MRGTMRVLRLAVFGLFLQAISGIAVAQQGGPSQGWSGYSPGYAWGSGVGGVTGSSAPTTVYYNPGQGWVGYQPGRGWVAYNPGTTWQYVAPGAGATRVMTSPPVRQNTHYGVLQTGNVTRYREFGTGRRVPMAKPWLPGSF